MTQRKRATGFALMDTAFAADAKFVRLARKAESPVEFAAAVGVFWLILADARRARSAIVHWEDYTEYADQIAALKDAKLLTTNGFLDETFDNWAPAYKVPKRTQPYPNVPDGTRDKGDSEHGAYPTVPDGNGSTKQDAHITSTHINSPHQPKVSGSELFMGWRGKGLHDGRHGEGCSVCHPELAKPAPRLVKP